MADLTPVQALQYFKGKENAFIAPVEASATSAHAYAAGRYFWKGGKLYKATAAIAIGDTITVGTNCMLAILGDEVSGHSDAIEALESPYVTVSGATPEITAEANKIYLCGTLESLDFTPPTSGMAGVVFTSGVTPTVITLPNTVVMPSDWSGTLEAGTTYELNFLNLYGVFQTWT